jgi:hypothetical protein
MRKESPLPLAHVLAFAAVLALPGGALFGAPQPKPPQTVRPNAPTRPDAPGKAVPAPAKPTSPGKTTLVDKILAVVDEDPILATDVDRVVKLGLQRPNPGESQEAFRKRILNLLIDERLRSHEVDRFGFTEVPVEAVEAEVTKIQKSFPDDRAFQKALAEVGLNLQGLRQRVTQQLLVVTYVDERLGPRVLIGSDEISKYYRTVLTPEMQKRGQPPPPQEEVRDPIREILKQQKLTVEMAKWTEELRAKADILVRSETGEEKLVPLPPVVKRISGAPQKPPR